MNMHTVARLLGGFNSLAVFVLMAIVVAWGQGFSAPYTGLESGWREALVQATDQRFCFGKDVVFTYGPYHQLYSNAISDHLLPFLIGRLVYGLEIGRAHV